MPRGNPPSPRPAGRARPRPCRGYSTRGHSMAACRLYPARSTNRCDSLRCAERSICPTSKRPRQPHTRPRSWPKTGATIRRTPALDLRHIQPTVLKGQHGRQRKVHAMLRDGLSDHGHDAGSRGQDREKACPDEADLRPPPSRRDGGQAECSDRDRIRHDFRGASQR